MARKKGSQENALPLANPPRPQPLAEAAAMVRLSNARITVLAPELLRLEWSADGTFEDRASLVFTNRRLAVPDFDVRQEDDELVLETAKLTLRYQTTGRFTRKNLKIRLRVAGKQVTWWPGKPDTGNLGGTAHTLDEASGAIPLEPGLLSRNGWTLVDDSQRPLFDDSDWPWVCPRPGGERQDWYFFGYGHDYKKALYDFTRVAGRIPLPPRFAFGLWWSRYWAYTDQELEELVEAFAAHRVPLDVLVIDMDWHLTFNLRWHKRVLDQAGHWLGWSGYTWNRTLFPDPARFLQRMKQHNLEISLNLHPASGVQPHEQRYPEMARAMGVDPASKKYVPFDIIDKKFTESYLEILHAPLEAQGVDFWWLDWQQGSKTKIPGLHPAWWLNYVHFTAMQRRRRDRRPLIFHRWGGLGNHRYQIGFSGDTVSNWESLAFQPYFTATAANVGYGYWSHDIGGHFPGNISPELYIRWLQFGIFSPILRTHTTKNAAAERRFWAYPADAAAQMRELVRLRYRLIPYIYTAARQAYDTGVSLCRPLYYEWPEADNAYAFTGQYLFGNDMLVAPVCRRVSAQTLRAEVEIWLPPGTWFEWCSGSRLPGNRVVRRAYALDEMSLFIREGAIIPLQPEMQNSTERPVDPLTLLIFPGAHGQAEIYEDHGDSQAYETDEFATTSVTHTLEAADLRRVTIAPSHRGCPGVPAARAYELRLVNEWPLDAVVCDGQSLDAAPAPDTPGYRYDGNTVTAVIRTPVLAADRKVELLIRVDAALAGQRSLLDSVRGQMAAYRRVMPLLNALWPAEWSPEELVAAAQTGRRIELTPARALDEVRRLRDELPAVLRQIEALEVDDRENIRCAIAHLTGERAGVEPVWRCARSEAAWSARAGHTCLHWRGRFWLLGGVDERGLQNDIWSSADAVDWRQETAAAPWPARRGAACVVFKNRMYLLGGEEARGVRSDVWETADGRKWKRICAQAGWPARRDHAVTEFAGKLWLLGGAAGGTKFSDIWVSDDARRWQRVTAAPGWTPRAGHACLAFDGRLWVVGGQASRTCGDVWHSSDGVHWVEAGKQFDWIGRTDHTLVACNRFLYLFGGRSHDWGCSFADLWCSPDGYRWTQTGFHPPLPSRYGHAAFGAQDRVWVLGGSHIAAGAGREKPVLLADIWSRALAGDA